jgi:hypothetical protein
MAHAVALPINNTSSNPHPATPKPQDAATLRADIMKRFPRIRAELAK